jgi:hypothetical protein
MYPRSDEFTTEVVSNDQRIVSYCEVWSDDSRLATLQVEGGSVTDDATRQVRRDCVFDLVDLDGTYTPADLSSMLAPGGNEVRPYRGLILPSGITEAIPQGVYRLGDVDISESSSGVSMSFSAQDRSERISANKWLDPYQIPKGGNVADVIADIAVNRWPGCPLGFSTAVTEATTNWGMLEWGANSDPWRDMVNIAFQFGLDLYFDRVGVLQLRPIPDITDTAAALTLVEGETCVITDAKRRLSASQTFNGAIVEVESSDLPLPLRGEAWDDDPSSLTRRDGKFGPRPQWYSAPLVGNQAALDDSARRILSKNLGLTEAIDWSMVVDPCVDSFDVAKVTRSRLKVDALYILDQVVTPFGPADAMSAVARTRRVS